MTEELNLKLSELAKIRDEQVTLEEKRRKIESEVFPILEQEGIDSAETPLGKFSKKVSTKIKYHEEIKTLLNDIQKEIDIKLKEIEPLKEDQEAIMAKAENDGKCDIESSITYAYKAIKI